MKGILLAGGSGTRLRPMTLVTNKHLLPVYNKPMIYYPIETLVEAGIKDIMIITGNESAGDFLNLLGDGKKFNANFTYRVQVGSGGIAHALSLCEDFAGGDSVMVILGDNVFDSVFFDNKPNDRINGAKIFFSKVFNPNRFGVPTFDEDGKVIEITEKPENPASNYAVTGLYCYDSQVWDIIKTLKPSGRGELEITDVNNWYIKRGQMEYETIKTFWSDAGTPKSLSLSSNFMRKKINKNLWKS